MTIFSEGNGDTRFRSFSFGRSPENSELRKEVEDQ